MRQRCNDPGSKSYARYGGRGIKVSERWDSFPNFLADMGSRPSPRHSLERIDNAKGYEPGNARWATATEQANNRRSSRLITYQGETLTSAEWTRRTGLARHIIEQRLDKLGWSVERAFTTPVRPLRR